MLKEALYQVVETPVKQILNQTKSFGFVSRLRFLKLAVDHVEVKILHNILNTRATHPEELDQAVVSHLAFDVLDVFIRHREGHRDYFIKKAQLEWFSELAFTDELRLKMVWPEQENDSPELDFNAFFYTRGDQMVGQGQWTLIWRP